MFLCRPLPASSVYKALVEPGAQSRAVMVQALPGEPERSPSEGFASERRTAPAPAVAVGRNPPGSQPQPGNGLLPTRRTPRSDVGSLQPIVKSCSRKPPSSLSRRLRAPASRRRLSSSEGASSVCGFPLGPVSGLLYLSLAWVNRSRRNGDESGNALLRVVIDHANG